MFYELYDFGFALKTIRGEKGFTMRALKDLTGISAGEIAMIESGKRQNLRFDTLFKLAEGMDISIHRFLILARMKKDISEMTQIIELAECLAQCLDKKKLLLFKEAVEKLL